MVSNVAAGSGLSDIYAMVSSKQQVTFNELNDISLSRGIPKSRLEDALRELERMKVIVSRNSGGVLTYYPLQEEDSLRKVLIVEDDKNINKLMALSIGKGFEVKQIYDGGEAVPTVRKTRPDLVILDLMLPNKDGIDICKTIKSDPEVSDTIVIIVSAMDPIASRYKGIESGADYYIKKPFDPIELRSLVTIFLKKKGKRFDPLIDLPTLDGISKEINHSISEGEGYSIGTIKVDGLGEYATKFGPNSAVVILRLVSQLMQDITKQKAGNMFVGFLDSEIFVIAGEKSMVKSAVGELNREFDAVLPFILQDEGYKSVDLDITNLFESKEVPKLSLVYNETLKKEIVERRGEIMKSKGDAKGDIGSYTYDEIIQLFGNNDLDIRITRDSGGTRLHVGKDNRPSKED
jgi:DNA-binding response OmpR family regulator